MGEFTNIILALAIILFGSFATLTTRSIINARTNIVSGEIELSAYSEAESIIERAWAKEFDEQCITTDIEIDDTTSLSSAASFGTEGLEGKYAIRDFDDLDDFHDPLTAFKVFDTTDVMMEYEGNLEIFYQYVLKTKVYYVDNSDQYSATQTPYKRLTVLIDIISDDIVDNDKVTISGLGTISNVDWNLMLSKTFTYTGPDYHGL